MPPQRTLSDASHRREHHLALPHLSTHNNKPDSCLLMGVSHGQLLTPSSNSSEAPKENAEAEDIISISTSFNPTINPQSDTTLLSSDNVRFYVHWAEITTICPEIFKRHLSSVTPEQSAERPTQPIRLDITASQLNVISHALHGTSPAANSPDFDTLAAAVDHMPKYGMSPRRFIRPTSPIYELFLSHAPLRPLDLYALAAFHSIHSLCVAASSHLLSLDVTTITDPMAERIGPVYLKKLILLHFERSSALRNILMSPPQPHPPTKQCSFDDQRKVTRAWALAGASLVWDATPDLSTYSIQKSINFLFDGIDCKECADTTRCRIKNVLSQWVAQKHTI